MTSYPLENAMSLTAYPLNLLSKSIPFSYPYPVQNHQSEEGITETRQRKKVEFICVSSSYDNKQKTSLPHNPKVVGSNPAPATKSSTNRKISAYFYFIERLNCFYGWVFCLSEILCKL